MKSVYFRLELSNRVGLGHFVRCNEIAEYLKQKNVYSTLIVSNVSEKALIPVDHAFSTIETIDSQFDAIQTSQLVTQGNGVLLVDHYHCNDIYQKVLMENNIIWGQYDYKRSGAYLGAFVININPSVTRKDYRHCEIHTDTELLLGCSYAVIKTNLKKHKNQRHLSEQKQLFMSLGAGCGFGLFSSLLELLVPFKFNIQIVTSISNKADIDKFFKFHPNQQNVITVYYDHKDIGDIMAKCQYALITAGTLAFELNYLKIPFLVGYLSDNQEKLADTWHKIGAGVNLGNLVTLNSTDLSTKLDYFTKTFLQNNKTMNSVVDGHGSQRIGDKLIHYLYSDQ